MMIELLLPYSSWEIVKISIADPNLECTQVVSDTVQRKAA